MDYYEEHLYDELEESHETEGNSQNDHYIDQINCYNHEEEYLVNQALKEMGFPFLAEVLKNEEIDFQAFKNLNTISISNLLKDYKVGLAVKFEMRYCEWKSKLPAQKQIDDVDTMIKPGIVIKILNSTKEGEIFMNKANRDVKFDRGMEKFIASSICSFFFAKKQRLPVSDLKLLAEDIERCFPKELSSIYVQIQQKLSSGVLYDKYNNMLRTLRKSDLMPITNRKRKIMDTPESAKKSQVFRQEEINSNEFVKYTTADIDYVLLASHWRQSTFIRFDFLKQNPDKKISTIYRALLRPDGNQLISIDFENHFPNRNFKKVWMENESKLKQYLLQNVHQSSLVAQIKNADKMSSNQSLAIILLALHNVLFGDKASLEKGKNKFYKPTVYDAFNFLLLIVDDESSFEQQLSDWTKQIEAKQLKHQCLIIGFGSSIENLREKYCVVIEDIRYIFEGVNSLLSALETVMQIYHVLDIEYPSLNSSVYSFLSLKYLDIKVGKKTCSSKVIRLISALE